MLLDNYRSLLEQGWQPVFAQPRSHQRAMEHALAWPSVLGERTIAGTVVALGRDQQDWSADYKIYSRSPWSSQALFEPVVDDYLKRYPKGPGWCAPVWTTCKAGAQTNEKRSGGSAMVSGPG